MVQKNKNIFENPQTDFAQALQDFRDNLINHIELAQLRAQLCHEYYLELIEQGFEKCEALELCKNFNIS